MEQYWKEKIGAYLHGIGRRPSNINFPVDIKVSDETLFGKAYAYASSILKLDIPELKKERLIESDTLLVTHPLSINEPLMASYNWSSDDDKQLASIVKEMISDNPGKNDFANLFFCLVRNLKMKNVGNLGAFWDLFPADPCLPDVSIWNQMALTSAIYSSLYSDPDQKCSMVVYSITPVQGFISKSRKLRDYWTASIILSYLAFQGISAIMDGWGPDHILYPSLKDQSLVEEYAKKQYGISPLEEDMALNKVLEKTGNIASFPNKFVFIVPHSQVESSCTLIKEKIDTEWLRLGEMVASYLEISDSSIWKKEMENYWTHSWASADLVTCSTAADLCKFLRAEEYLHEVELTKKITPDNGDAVLYGSTHSLVQTVLAAGKLHPKSSGTYERYGMLCPQCGEHEVLHSRLDYDSVSLNSYRRNVEVFWASIPEDKAKGNLKEGERLCFVCLLKRFLPIAMQMRANESELLGNVFKNNIRFPSTAEIALKLSYEGQEGDEADFRDSRVGKENRDSYYCHLLMDGDKMGNLVNGVSIGARWENVINPEIVDEVRISADILNRKRSVDPSLHAAISDSLNYFARYSVAPLVEEYGGKLIYAGGDDVSAIVPIESNSSKRMVNVLQLADEIQRRYRAGFLASINCVAREIKGSLALDSYDKIYMGLGNSEDISISAGILIVHNKQALSEAIAESHSLLNRVAKERGGRNACAIRLEKRSGGSRDVFFKWDAKNAFNSDKTYLTSFSRVMEAVESGYLSRSLLYYFESLGHILEPILDNKKLLLNAVRYEVEHSSKNGVEYIDDLAGIMFLEVVPGKLIFQPSAAIIAGFIGSKGEK